MIQVKSLQNLGAFNEKSKFWLAIESIFFESSVKKDFSSPEEKNAFRFKYLDWYAKNHPELFFVAMDQDNKIHGYICGTSQTAESSELLKLHPWTALFAHLFLQYPAHLHINCAGKSRGMGLGSTLLNVFENTLQSKQIVGVHLVTSPHSRNVGFYEKNGYKLKFE